MKQYSRCGPVNRRRMNRNKDKEILNGPDFVQDKQMSLWVYSGAIARILYNGKELHEQGLGRGVDIFNSIYEG